MGLGSGPGAPFAPTDIAGLLLWLKADALALSDGAAVSSWTDSSGNGRHFTQATGTRQPLYKSGIIGGKPVVRFDGTDDLLTHAGVSTGSNSWTAFFVLSHSQVAPFGMILIELPSGAGLYLNSDGTMGRADFYTGASDIYGTNFVANTPHLITCHVNAGSLQLYLDGVIDGTPSGGVGAVNYAAMGDDGVGSILKADLADILVYNSALSTTDRTNVETYLKTKYGL